MVFVSTIMLSNRRKILVSRPIKRVWFSKFKVRGFELLNVHTLYRIPFIPLHLNILRDRFKANNRFTNHNIDAREAGPQRFIKYADDPWERSSAGAYVCYIKIVNWFSFHERTPK